MIWCQHNQGMISHPGLGQLIHQPGQSLLQFQIGCNISLGGVRIWQISYRLCIFCRHIISSIAVREMPADSQIVDVKWFLSQVFIHRCFHHIIVGLWPVFISILVSFNGQRVITLVGLSPLITQIWVRQGSPVHVAVKMISNGSVAIIRQNICQSKWQIGTLFSCFSHADRKAVFRI